jgi:putative acyl-CoA dehydrogenase
MQRFPDCVPALMDELRLATGSDRHYDAALDALESDFAGGLARHEGQARRLVERIALLMSASLLLRHSPDVADAFIAARLAGQWSGHFGDLPLGVDAGAIARRAVPVLI